MNKLSILIYRNRPISIIIYYLILKNNVIWEMLSPAYAVRYFTVGHV